MLTTKQVIAQINNKKLVEKYVRGKLVEHFPGLFIDKFLSSIDVMDGGLGAGVLLNNGNQYYLGIINGQISLCSANGQQDDDLFWEKQDLEKLIEE